MCLLAFLFYKPCIIKSSECAAYALKRCCILLYTSASTHYVQSPALHPGHKRWGLRFLLMLQSGGFCLTSDINLYRNYVMNCIHAQGVLLNDGTITDDASLNSCTSQWMHKGQLKSYTSTQIASREAGVIVSGRKRHMRLQYQHHQMQPSPQEKTT